mmetsp:Transcript_26388/g.63655  ORF Transcript_26388/g.63655 Transcript_26388/m.63655 type:complete len:132 (+) Transcript_26388:258-653(+)|eukprot:CAMPEP_0114490738 /NCGR_PEP_ID=MMETSP0109-20121206/2609_1 /TAXON_ID=29199 /ORGANISM="Chlorarachnion reptans, Strain CCCM449" /LENGTH=131 /DNA_ID=CAMNT_0001667389 /DNA_START=173 /DNA_END=568 /DNA_ORIENTATION=+
MAADTPPSEFGPLPVADSTAGSLAADSPPMNSTEFSEPQTDEFEVYSQLGDQDVQLLINFFLEIEARSPPNRRILLRRVMKLMNLPRHSRLFRSIKQMFRAGGSSKKYVERLASFLSLTSFVIVQCESKCN